MASGLVTFLFLAYSICADKIARLGCSSLGLNFSLSEHNSDLNFFKFPTWLRHKDRSVFATATNTTDVRVKLRLLFLFAYIVPDRWF